MASIILPLHGKGDSSVHRQLMFDATRGKGFHPDFMARTMVEAGLAPEGFNKPEPSKRQAAKAKARVLYLARCNPPSRALNKDRAGITARVQARMFNEVWAITV